MNKNTLSGETLSGETLESIQIQDNYDLTELKNTENLTIFFIPSHLKISGGIISIFTLCNTFRLFDKNSLYLVCTLPGNETYSQNDYFTNNEKIYRFQQIIRNAIHVKNITIHIPEIYIALFLRNLNSAEHKFLQSKNLHINVLNQNIELMPSSFFVNKLKSLTNNITQTTAHKKYCTQEICDKWQIPTHHIFNPPPSHKTNIKSFQDKEKIIVVSPDLHEDKDKILKKITTEFKDFKIFIVDNIPFDQYLDVLGRAFFSISFGEGFDGYFIRAPKNNNICFSVYNTMFFPDSSWLDFKNVFENYQDMYDNIIDIMNELLNNQDSFLAIKSDCLEKIKETYNSNLFSENIMKFLKKEYYFYPKCKA